MSKPIFYKVCKIIDGELCSAVLNKTMFEPKDYKYLTQYKFGKWVYPKIPNSKIYVFKTENAALSFLHIETLLPYKGLVIPCWVKGEPEHINKVSSKWDTHSLFMWWNPPYKNYYDYMLAPLETYAVDAVFLLNKLPKV